MMCWWCEADIVPPNETLWILLEGQSRPFHLACAGHVIFYLLHHGQPTVVVRRHAYEVPA